MIVSKKLLLAAFFAALVGTAESCMATTSSANVYWTYMKNDSTTQYIYMVSNPNYTGSWEWWNCPEGLMPYGFPTTAAGFVIATDTTVGSPTNGLSTISFITILDDASGKIIPGGSAKNGTCRLCLAVGSDGVTVEVKDISVAGSAVTKKCLWKIINDGPDANGVQHSRIMQPETGLFMTFSDGLVVAKPDEANPNNVQFSMVPSNVAQPVVYNGDSGPSPLTGLDGLAGLPEASS